MTAAARSRVVVGWTRRGTGRERDSLGEGGDLFVAPALAALDKIDDQRDAFHAVACAQAVLDEVRVVARHPRARVDLDRKARRALTDLGHVDQLQTMLTGAAPSADRRLARLHRFGQEAIQLG